VFRTTQDARGTRPGPSPRGLSPAPARLSRRSGWPAAIRVRVLQPRAVNRPVWAPPRWLAATCGISFDFFSSGYGDVSLPPVSPPARYAFTRGSPGRSRRGCPIRKPTGHGPPAPRRGISPLAASFVAICRQGIRHAPEKLARKKLKSQRAASRPSCPCFGTPRTSKFRGTPFCIDLLLLISLISSGCQIARILVGAPGLEPGASSLSEKRSNQLSYAPRIS
jgi:hypothetical protein